MNVFHENLKNLIQISALFLLMFGFQNAWGQGTLVFRTEEVILGTSGQVQFSSLVYTPYITKAPKRGVANLNGNGNAGVSGANVLNYTPSSLGRDTVEIRYYTPNIANSPSPSLMIVEFINSPSFVDAIDDYLIASSGVFTSVNVLANDLASRANLIVRSVPKANNCTATLNADSTAVIVQTAADFEGTAYFNYTLCDDLGNCDMATVNIMVQDAVMEDLDIQVFLKKGDSDVLLMPLNGETLITAPTNGSLNVVNGIITYSPNSPSFVGTDYVAYQGTYNGAPYTKTVHIKVLDAATPNQFVFNDFVATPENTAKNIHILRNDIGGTFLSGVAITSAPLHGTVISLGGGVYKYTPNAGYFGTDVFTYRAFRPGFTGAPEFGKVFIQVDDQAPAFPVYGLTTPKDMPLVIDYNIPFTDYTFNILQNGSKGQIVYLAGAVDTIINGRSIKGTNLLVYIPTGNATGNDQVTVDYCTVNNHCYTTTININIKNITTPANQACAGADCVWPGDVNRDGNVNMLDLLPVGICMGEVGTPRPVPGSSWNGRFANNWNSIREVAPFDIKHVDTDGDGIVHVSDTTAIVNNYGLQRSLTPSSAHIAQVGPQLDLVYTGEDTLYAGDIATFDIIMGWANNPVVDVHGITFQLPYPTAFVDPASVHINFLEDNSNWMTYSSPTVTLRKEMVPGLVDVGYTRTSGKATSGYGLIGRLDFIVVEDIAGLKNNSLVINTGLTNIHLGGVDNQLRKADDVLRQIVIAARPEQVKAITEKDLNVFPNPATQYAIVHLNGFQKEIDQLMVYNVQGMVIHQMNNVAAKNVELATATWSEGMYFIKVQANDGTVITKKLQVTK